MTYTIFYEAQAYMLLGRVELTPERLKDVKWAIKALRKCKFVQLSNLNVE
jgi:hypothetical protein